MKRSTRTALSLAKNCGIRMWCETHLRNKWTWAGHISRMAQGRLARRAMEWRGAEWQQSELHLPARLRIRRVARTHWFRWEDELRRYGTSCLWQSWQQLSQDRETFASHANEPTGFGGKTSCADMGPVAIGNLGSSYRKTERHLPAMPTRSLLLL